MTTHTITAFYDNRSEAETALESLKNIGVTQSYIHSGSESSSHSSQAVAQEYRKGFWDSITDFFISDEDKETYSEGLSRGGFVLTANVDDMNLSKAQNILEEHGSVDLSERESQWRQDGWTGSSAKSSLNDSMPGGIMMAQDQTFNQTNKNSENVIQVVEEELSVGKRQVDQGRVRVHTRIVETPVEENVRLREESIHIERRPVSRSVDHIHTMTDAFKDHTIELTESREEAMVAKQARVVEEVIISKDVNERVETVSDTVRKTEVDIEDERKNLGKNPY